jgi:predicted nucleotidyltransferase
VARGDSENNDAEQVTAVIESVIQVLGDGVVAVYRYGSAVLGGLRRFSDLDFLVIIDHPTTDDQRRRLVAEIMSVSGGRGTRVAGRPVEVTVVLQEMVERWQPDQEREFQYGEWLREEYENGWVPCPQPDPDMAPLIATVLTASVPLVGPPAEEVIGPVPYDRLVASMREAVPSLLEDLEADTANVLLALARMWYTKDSGVIVNKEEAAIWAIQRLPAELRTPLEHARAIYTGETSASFDRSRVDAWSTARYLSSIIGT